MRKYVECTFSILKDHFRILKVGIRLHGVDVADKTWKTYCAMHDLILEKDGISGKWDGEVGLFDVDKEVYTLPFALSRLESGERRRNYDSSRMGVGNDTTDEDEDNCVENQYTVNDAVDIDTPPGEIADIYKMSCDNFRKKLIQYFDILFRQNKVSWPISSKN